MARHDWVILTASSIDGIPEEIDHIMTKGAHPEEKLNPQNLRGISARNHRLRHQGKTLPPPTSLESIWNG